MSNKMRSFNTISGKEGRLFLDGEELAYIKEFEATIEKNKVEVPIMGRRMMGHKATGGNGTGTATFYKVTSKFVRIMMEYAKGGPDPYFTFQSVLDDEGSGRGTERVTLYDVNFDSAKVASLAAEGDPVEEEIPFTFEDIDMPEELEDDLN